MQKSYRLTTIFNVTYFLPLLVVIYFIAHWQYFQITKYHHQQIQSSLSHNEDLLNVNLKNHKKYLNDLLLDHLLNQFYDFKKIEPDLVDGIFIEKNGEVLEKANYNIDVNVLQLAKQIISLQKKYFKTIEIITIDKKKYFVIIEKMRIIEKNLGKVQGNIYAFTILNDNSRFMGKLIENTNIEFLLSYYNNEPISKSFFDNKEEIYFSQDGNYVTKQIAYNDEEVIIEMVLNITVYNELIKNFYKQAVTIIFILFLLGLLFYFIIKKRFILKLVELRNFIKNTFLTESDNYSVSGVLEIDEIAFEFEKMYTDLLSEKERFDLLMKSTGSGFWDWDIGSGDLFYSKTFDKVLGHQTKDIQNTFDCLKKLIHKDDLALFLKKLNSHFKDNKYIFEHEFRMQNSSKEYIWVHVTGKALCRKRYICINESPYRMVGFIRDVTEKKNFEKKFIHSERLASMGQMISMIAHQWRQPLNAISMTVNNMKLQLIMDKYEKEFFEKEIDNISEYTQHLSTTINDFRNFFKQDNEKISITIEEVIKKAIYIFENGFHSYGIKVSKDFQCNKKVFIIANEVEQVIISILQNSQDALVENKIDNPQIKLTTSCENDMVVLTISDNGGGIPKDILNKIFEPYFSTKKEKEGTGIGLYMGKTIIEEHCSGALEVSSENDQTTFTIKLGLESKDEKC